MLGQRVQFVFLDKFFRAFLFSCLVFAALFAAVSPAQANPKYAAFVMDADSGMILYQRYANKKLHPASLTKVMTLLMLFEAMEAGRVNLNDRIHISNHAASMVPSKIGLSPGSTISVKDAISALVTKSANDIAVAVGEHLAGSERNFAYMMTRRAQDIGMSDTHFMNASGLHDPRQISTARDMAKMARYVIKRYPSQYRYFSTKSFTYNGHTYHSHNRLMSSYKGMDGMKTGYVNASGFNLIASAVRGNRRLIGVVFGGRSTATRNSHMAELLDNAFAQLGEVRYASANDNITSTSANASITASSIPTPSKKPGSTYQVASASPSAQAYAPAPAAYQKPTPKPGTLDAQLANLRVQNGVAVPPPYVDGTELMGQGDIDEVLTKRVNAGLMTVAAHDDKVQRDVYTAALPPAEANATENSWSIQVGAFQSKAQSMKALKTALETLPRYYAQAKPQIMPLQTANSRIYRARLSGYNSHDAYAACAYIRECITIAP
jgi:D-alanyl-D-alanine carboxypeptidase